MVRTRVQNLLTTGTFAAALAAVFVTPVASQATNFSQAPLLECDIEFTRIGRNATLTPKTELIATYLRRSFTSAQQNSNWIQIAKSSDPTSGILFGDIEFSVLQKINTLTNDKNLVTSMSNKHKELTFKAFESLQKKYESQVEIITYSDFKSVRVAIVPRDKLQPLPSEIKEDFAKAFEDVNGEFSRFIQANKLDVDGEVETWFRGGLGVTADEANFAARMSRDMGLSNSLRDFENPAIRENMSTYLKWAESMRQVDLAPSDEMKNLIEDGFVKNDVLDILKKNPDGPTARARLKAKYDADLDEVQIERLYVYNEIVDKFTPGIHVPQRNIASLENADLGGLSADFSGLGAKNRGAAAQAIAKGRDLREAIALARDYEQAVTKDFEAETRAFKEIIDRYVDSSVSSGDDFVGTAGTKLSYQTKREIVTEIAKLENPSAQRLSFISNGVKQGERNILAAHGEAIEKVLRQELEGRVSKEKLQRVVFAVDMLGKSAGKGTVKLIMGEGVLRTVAESGTSVVNREALTKSERLEIRRAFRRAIKKFNDAEDRDLTKKSYRAR